jgi:hypothetical protein
MPLKAAYPREVNVPLRLTALMTRVESTYASIEAPFSAMTARARI